MMPDLSEFPPEKLRLLRQGNFVDAMPIHLLTGTTLATLARAAPESSWDERRFRPNLFVAADDGDGYPEQRWIGRRPRVGTAGPRDRHGLPALRRGHAGRRRAAAGSSRHAHAGV